MAMKVTINIPAGYSYSKKQEIAARIAEQIINNTLAGFDKNGNSFKNYTKSYADFKGVNRNDVDLKLTGSMLEALKVLKIGRDYIDIGFDGRTNQDKKAEGNILGSYGKLPDPSKARDFLGLPKSQLNEILAEFKMSEEESANQNFEDNVDRIAKELSPNQLEKIRQQQLLSSLGLDDNV